MQNTQEQAYGYIIYFDVESKYLMGLCKKRKKKKKRILAYETSHGPMFVGLSCC